MANGNAALQLIAPEPAPVATAADKPASEIETKIGEAVANGVVAIALAVLDWQTEGAMTPTSRTWSGAMLGQVAQLRLDTLGEMPDFAEVAFTEGRRALQGRVDGVLLTCLGQPGQVDVVIDELIAHVLDISAKVVDTELALRAN